ncbi:MAG: hypothetical protein AAGG69_00750 [Pseudomonadota bacterium]
MKTPILSIAAVIMAGIATSGCVGGVAAGVAQGAVSNAVSAPLQNRALSGMTCAQIERDIATRKLGMVNPLAIPQINAQVRRSEAAARAKGCPGYGVAEVQTVAPTAPAVTPAPAPSTPG